MPFDPDAAAQPGTGVFGLPFTHESRIVLVPVPFDATTSYGGGASGGPAAIRAASAQVDLYDHQFGRVYEAGIFMEEESAEIAALGRRARKLAAPIIEAGGAVIGEGNAKAVAEVDRACERVNDFTHAAARQILKERKTAGMVGGDHSTPFGFIKACAEHVAKLKGNKGLGILHVDAHMDLRDAFEGFAWSHASIMHNVLTRIPGVSRLVQVGIRDFGESELEFARKQGKRVATHFDLDWSRSLDKIGRAGGFGGFTRLCEKAVGLLPRHVYVSFDIDGLDPSLCPHTGTPVPGGFSFNQACILLETLARSGRTIVGFDLNEVTPDPDPQAPEWDANVGARILYKLCGAAAAARG